MVNMGELITNKGKAGEPGLNMAHNQRVGHSKNQWAASSAVVIKMTSVQTFLSACAQVKILGVKHEIGPTGMLLEQEHH